MKSKIGLKSFINYLTVSLFAIGTLVSIMYLFIGRQITVYISLIAFSLGFCFLTVSFLRNVIIFSSIHKKFNELKANGENFDEQSKSKILEEIGEDIDFGNENPQKISAKRRNQEIVKAVFAGLFAIFTIIVMLLY